MKKREDIIKSALELFSKKGLNQTTIEEIAQHSKVSIGVIYHHFSGKESIFQEVLNRTTGIMEEEIDKAMAISRIGTRGNPGNEILRYFGVLIKKDRDVFFKACRFVFANSFFDQQLRDYMEQVFLERHCRFIEASLDRMVNERYAEPFDTRSVARIIAGYLVSVAIEALTFHGLDVRRKYIHFIKHYRYIIRCAIEGRLI